MLPSRRRLISESRKSDHRIDRAMIAETGVIPAGMQFIRDTFPFDVVDKKDVMVEDAHGREMPIMRVTGLIQNGDVQNANGRFYSTNDVLAPAVKSIQEDVSKRAVMGEFDHPCRLNPDFKVLTLDGWKKFVDIKIGDLVWSRVNGNAVASMVTEIIDEPYDGPAYRIFNNNICDEYTPGHKLVLLPRQDRGIKTTEEYATIEYIYQNRSQFKKYSIPKTANWSETEISDVVIGGVTVEKSIALNKPHLCNDLVIDQKKFCMFLGLYLSEGNIQGNNGFIINQTNRGGREIIENILNDLHPELKFTTTKRGFYCNDARLCAYLKPLGDKYTKYIPASVKSYNHQALECLLKGFILGDGRSLVATRGSRAVSNKHYDQYVNTLDVGVYSRQAMFTVSERLINDLHECLIKCGWSGRISKVIADGDCLIGNRVIKQENKRPLYQLYVSRTNSIYLDQRHTQIEKIHHSGRIYCLSVTHGNFYMQANGCSYWTGNCDAKIHLDRVSHLMTKVWMEGRKVYGEAEILHKLPCGAALRGLFEHKVRVGISSRGVGDMEVVEHNGQEVYRVMPGYSFVTWDAVAEPSVGGAILNIQEGLVKRLRPIKEKKHLFSEDTYQDLLVKEINDFFGISKKKIVPVKLMRRK